jgi:hypothetical protein
MPGTHAVWHFIPFATKLSAKHGVQQGLPCNHFLLPSSCHHLALVGPLPDAIPVDSNLQTIRLGNGCPVSPPGTRPADVAWVPCGKGFSGPIPPSLASAQLLQILDLSWNTQLTGTLPELLDGVQQLDVSFCSLSGPLPGGSTSHTTVLSDIFLVSADSTTLGCVLL